MDYRKRREQARAEQENQVVSQDQAGDDGMGKVVVVLARLTNSSEVHRVGVLVFKLADAFIGFSSIFLAARAGSAAEVPAEVAASAANTSIGVGLQP